MKMFKCADCKGFWDAFFGSLAAIILVLLIMSLTRGIGHMGYKNSKMYDKDDMRYEMMEKKGCEMKDGKDCPMMQESLRVQESEVTVDSDSAE